MMKSFFKKLAFVMALAMVVSMVAPAGSALAAEAGVSLQGTKTIVETFEFEKAGDSQDFSFQGAPKDWKTTSKWTSSNEAVATVDKMGVVTAVAAGTATITITSGADKSYAESVVVTVKEEVKASNFTVKQTSTDTFVLTFGSADEAKKVSAETLTATMLIGDVEMTTPIKTFDAKDENVTVVLFGDVTDGFTYRFEYDKNVVEVEASIGEIAYAAYTYYTDKAGDGKAFVSTDEEEAIVKLAYTLYDENGVNVTSRYKDVDAVFELAADDDTVDLDSEGEVIFERAGAYVINLTVAWEDAEGDEQQTPVYTGVVLAENRPAHTLTFAKAGFVNMKDLADGAETNFLTKKGVFWNDNLYTDSWIFGDDDDYLRFAGLFKDNRNNDVVSGKTNYDYGYFTFGTSNEDVLTVEDDGVLNIYEPGVATVLIYFTNTTGEEDVTTLVGTKRITVKPERVPTSYTLNTKNVTIGNAGSTQTGAFEVVVYDQYGGKIALENHEADIVVEASDDENLVSLAITEIDNNGPEYKISFDGSKYTFKKDETYDTFSYNFEMDPDKENASLKRGSAKLKVKVYDVAEAVESVKALEDEKYYYNVSANTGANVDLYVDFITSSYSKDWYAKDVVKAQNIWWQESAVWVNYENSKGLTLAGVPESKIVPLTKDQKTGEAGYVYYKVTAPEGAVKGKNWDYTVEDGKIDLTFNKNDYEYGTYTDDNGKEQQYIAKVNPVGSVKYNDTEYEYTLEYAKTGNYKIELMYVKNTSADEKGIGRLSELKTFTYTVSNSQPEVKYSDYNADLGNKTKIDFTTTEGEGDDAKTVVDKSALLDIIDDNFLFTFNGKTDNIGDFDDLEVVDAIGELRSGNLRVVSMLVKVTLDVPDYGGDYKKLNIYQVVKVNKTIKPEK